VMIYVISNAMGRIYAGTLEGNVMVIGLTILACTLILRFFLTKKTTEMSYLASKTVKRVMREQIYKKILRMGNTYREHATTAQLVQEFYWREAYPAKHHFYDPAVCRFLPAHEASWQLFSRVHGRRKDFLT